MATLTIRTRVNLQLVAQALRTCFPEREVIIRKLERRQIIRMVFRKEVFHLMRSLIAAIAHRIELPLDQGWSFLSVLCHAAFEPRFFCVFEWHYFAIRICFVIERPYSQITRPFRTRSNAAGRLRVSGQRGLDPFGELPQLRHIGGHGGVQLQIEARMARNHMEVHVRYGLARGAAIQLHDHHAGRI